MYFIYLNPNALVKPETSPIKTLTRILLLPIVVIFGAGCGGIVSALVAFETGWSLGQQRQRAGLVEYEDDSPAFLGPFAAHIGLIGGAIGATVGAAVGWISKKVTWGAIAGCFPLLAFGFYRAFPEFLDPSRNHDGMLIWLAMALSGPLLVGALAGQLGKKL
jgi:hypothetical protein